MSRTRLNLFIEPEHARRLDELATMKGLSKSSIIAAALASFLSPDAADRGLRGRRNPAVAAGGSTSPVDLEPPQGG